MDRNCNGHVHHATPPPSSSKDDDVSIEDLPNRVYSNPEMAGSTYDNLSGAAAAVDEHTTPQEESSSNNAKTDPYLAAFERVPNF